MMLKNQDCVKEADQQTTKLLFWFSASQVNAIAFDLLAVIVGSGR
ncbi:MAG: hypothetical protein R2874_03045 [Desulfobacterales bacterium]